MQAAERHLRLRGGAAQAQHPVPRPVFGSGTRFSRGITRDAIPGAFHGVLQKGRLSGSGVRQHKERTASVGAGTSQEAHDGPLFEIAPD
ncbi:hypothetical protein GCM10010406_23240 [Streptomyces thermolineatus]|uniref:Uncharacterized protein n=1 Tax=Streptomyces thermolineatus TaxID=44033 RepID=A0ABN3LP45_9ACTN